MALYKFLLLARGRDRLETATPFMVIGILNHISYSLGDAIDWKQSVKTGKSILYLFSYSLGDAIDWKPNNCSDLFIEVLSPTR